MLELTAFLCDSVVKFWEMLMGVKYLGPMVALIPILKRLVSTMKMFVKP